MKISTTREKTMLFHGNAKSSRIAEASKCMDNELRALINTNGIYGNKDARNIKRYLSSMKNQVDRIRVTKKIANQIARGE